MAASTRWKDLEKDINRLRKHFLPEVFSATGVYANSNRVQAHTRAFLVLSHAEIESYLEEWAKEIARKTEDLWILSGKLSEPLAFLVAALGKPLGVPTNISTPGVKDVRARFEEASLKYLPEFYSIISENNGIKEHNVAQLFGPLGVPTVAFSPDLLLKLDNLGARRGTHAHRSAKAAAVIHMLDPKTEYDFIVDVLKSLQAFDAWLVNFKRSIR
jgi:hypothetical protein